VDAGAGARRLRACSRRHNLSLPPSADSANLSRKHR
jgi:hypothetical protein